MGKKKQKKIRQLCADKLDEAHAEHRGKPFILFFVNEENDTLGMTAQCDVRALYAAKHNLDSYLETLTVEADDDSNPAAMTEQSQ